MAEMVLVHGSCFDHRVWDGLTPVLRGLGHHVRAIDLPGRDGGAASLDQQGAAVLAAIRTRAVLIGHSAGGYPITMAAEMAREKVAGLIYLAAYVPRKGASVADLRRAGPVQPMRGAFRLSPDRTSYRFDPVAARALFFHDLADPDAQAAQLCAEPLAPQETAFGPLDFAHHMPRAAIIATQDCAIPVSWQREMAKGMACHDLDSGHCPHQSTPLALAERIQTILADWTKGIA